jgi:hypothetical protein
VRRALVLIVPLVVVGLAGAVVAFASRDSDVAFLYHQEHPLTIEPTQLEALVKRAPDPEPTDHGATAVRSQCRPGRGPRRNPWVCRVAYSSGRHIRYRIVIRPDGAYRGADATGAYVVLGRIPGAVAGGG